MPLDLDVVRAVRVNRSAVERRAATIGTRRTVKKEWQAAWLLRAITLIDLTTLSGDDTPGNVRRLCAKARQPLRDDLVEALGVAELDIKVGAVCVYHSFVPTAVEALEGSGHSRSPRCRPDFPRASRPIEQRVDEIRASVAAGATRDRHRHHARARAHRQLAGALRRGARIPRGLRRGAHEGDPRHRRARRRSATSRARAWWR